MAQRNEFTDAQIELALEEDWKYVLGCWRGDFFGKPPHFLCDECGNVSPIRQEFEVDHVQPCARGGAAIALNMAVLCIGCNQAKKARQFVPPGAGYAYRRHATDRNPDHVYHGPPSVTRQMIAQHPKLYDPKRYRK